MPLAAELVPDGGYRRRLAVTLALSTGLHALLLLLIIFDVLGPGGGFGIGSGPGFGIGAGGDAGLGEESRQIFALDDLPEQVTRPAASPVEARLAMMLERQPAVQPTSVPLPRDTAELPVVPLTAGRPAAMVTGVSDRLARAAGSTGGIGGGGGGGAGISFGRYVGELRRQGLDVAIVLDATGSMQNVIDETKERMVELVRSIQKLVPTARVGAVAFRDRPDGTATPRRDEEDFVVKWSDLTFNGPKVQAFVARLTAASGGDWEEAVREGIETAISELSWRRDAKKVIILVGSSPPHGGEQEAIDRLARRFAAMGGTISTIDVTGRLHEEHERRIHRWLWGKEPDEISPLPDFYAEVRESYDAIAAAGGGETIALGSNDPLIRHLLTLTFGSQWKKEMARISRGM